MLVAGVDEAGRGPCLGPMVLAVAVFEKKDEQKLLELGVKDSKLLSPAERERQLPEIKAIAKSFGSAHVSATELDNYMLRHSLNEIEAMKIGQLLNSLKEKPDIIYVDSPDVMQGNFAERIRRYTNFPALIRSEHKADLNYPAVSAASVIAKVERDTEIAKLAEIYGEVGSGYSHDEVTIKFIKNYLKEHSALPHFVRKCWCTNQRLLDERFQTKLL
ncbi:MAG: ribonuclease HII [Candidatus Diapherotrites archaeon]